MSQDFSLLITIAQIAGVFVGIWCAYQCNWPKQ